MISAETQTVYEFQDIPCKDCIYVASCAEELDFHIENAHYDEDDADEPSKTLSENPYNCNICSRKNATWGDLRYHLKTMHAETVRTCKFYLLGKCDFPENVCWFMHRNPSTAPSSQTLKEYKCGICKNVFLHKNDFMKHRKIDHTQFVPNCRDNENEACRSEKNCCWYIHEDEKEIPHQESSGMMARLFYSLNHGGGRKCFITCLGNSNSFCFS